MGADKSYQLRHAAGRYWLLDMQQEGLTYRKPIKLNRCARVCGKLIQADRRRIRLHRNFRRTIGSHKAGERRHAAVYHALENDKFDMNILLVGKNSNFTQLLVEKLDKEGHRIFLLTEEPKTVKEDTSRKIFESYHFSYHYCIRDVLSSIEPGCRSFHGRI